MTLQDTFQNSMDDTTRTGPEALGALLARARTERALEQREVATRMGLSVEIVRALEEGRFQGLEAPVFIRSYLLRYARLLGLPEQEIIDRYKQLGITESAPLRVPSGVEFQSRLAGKGVHWFSYLLLLAIVGWLGWLGFQEMSKHFSTSDTLPPASSVSTDDDPALSWPPPESVPADSAGDVAKTEPAPSAVQNKPEPAQTMDSAQLDSEQTVEKPAAEAVSAITEPASETTTTAHIPTSSSDVLGDGGETRSTSGADRLVLELSKDCWVDIKDAQEQRLAYGTLEAGTVRTFSGTAPFSLILGNSEAVGIKLNGKTIDPATYIKKGGVSRFVLGPSKQQSNGT